MKKFFVFLLILLDVSQSLVAQVEYPEPSPVSDKKVFYLYNRNYQGFLVGGNNYNTQASLSKDYAYKVILERYIDENGKWDGVTFFITDSVEMGDYRGMYRKMFVENNEKIYVDQDELGGTRDRDNLWTIFPIEGKDNVYRISPSSRNPNRKYGNKQLGVMALSVYDLPVVGLYDPISNNHDYEWCFVTCEEKERYFDKRQKQRASVKQRVLFCNAVHNIPDEQVVYMFNVDYDGFLIGGNKYNTQASLSKTDAHKVILHKYKDVGGLWDGKSYYITDSVRSGSYSGKYLNMYIAQDGVIWIDQDKEKSGHLDSVWEIMPSTDTPSVFYVRPSEKNKVFTPSALPDFYLGGKSHADFRELPTLELIKGKDGGYNRWAFVTEEQWIKLEAIERKEELLNYINIVKTMFPDVDISHAQQVYDDINTPFAEIENQIGQMRLILLSNGNKDKNSVDFTPLIENADFEGTGGLGWNMSFDVNVGSITWHGGDTQNYCAEAYQAIFEFYQEIKGIPNGLYRLDLQAFSRTRGADLAWLERDSSFVVSEVYANDMSLPVKNLMHTTFPSDDGEYDFLNTEMSEHLFNWAESRWLCMDGSYALHNLRATSLAFLKGYFNQSLYCIVDEGTIKIGIRERQKKTGSWVAWDNFRLTYLSETVENYREGIRCNLEKAVKIEDLAKKKGVDALQLSASLLQIEQVLQTEDIDSMRKSMQSINHTINQTRKLLEVQEFGDMADNSVISYSQIREEESDEGIRLEKGKQLAKQDSLKHILDEAESYLHMGYMVVDYSKELAQTHFQKSFDIYIDYPADDNVEHFDACVAALTSIYVELGLYDEAMAVKKRTIARLKLSKYLDNRIKIAMNYYEMGNISIYLKKDYKHAEELLENSKRIIDTLYEEAVESVSEFKKKEAQDLLLFVYYELAYAAAYQKKYDEALDIIERSVSIHPDNPYLYDRKGEILYMKGDKKGAIAMWRKVLVLNPNFPKKDSRLYKFLFEK